MGRLVVKAFDQIGLAPPARSVTVASAQCTSDLVARGEYLGVLGSMFLRFNPPSVRLKALPVAFPVAAPPINIVTVKHRALSPAAKMFAEFVSKIANSVGKTGGARGSRARLAQ